MPRPVHFEIHAENPERAMEFYGNLFGWTFTETRAGPLIYYLIKTGEPDEYGINGGMTRRMGANPPLADMAPLVAYTCTIDVDNIDVYAARALELGGIVILPKMALPGIGWLAYVKDCESNVFGMIQYDPSVA